MSWDDAPLLGGRELLPLMNLPFCLPFPLKEGGEELSDPVVLAGGNILLVGVELEDSETVDDTPERVPLVVTLPLPKPLPFGACANKETMWVGGLL